jgi:hypothetical protein
MIEAFTICREKAAEERVSLAVETQNLCRIRKRILALNAQSSICMN